MGSLWSHLISQGTDTQHLLSIFWLDCRENNLVFQEEQCWLFKGLSSRKSAEKKNPFGMEWVLQRRKWGKILCIMSLSTWKGVSDCIFNYLTSILYYKPVQVTQSMISASACSFRDYYLKKYFSSCDPYWLLLFFHCHYIQSRWQGQKNKVNQNEQYWELYIMLFWYTRTWLIRDTKLCWRYNLNSYLPHFIFSAVFLIRNRSSCTIVQSPKYKVLMKICAWLT